MEKPKSSKEKQQQKSRAAVKNEELVVIAPDGGYSWVVLVASFFVSFIIDGVLYSFGIVLDAIKLATGEREDICNLLNGLNSGFLFCSGPIVAGLVNQLGCRTVVMGGGMVTASMYMLSIFAPNVYYMLASYGVIGGISTGCTYITSLIVVAQYFDKKRGIATGITMAGSGVGSFVMAPLIGYLIKTYSWEFAFSICACFILQTVVCGALMRPIKPVPVSKLKGIELKDLKSDDVFEPTEDSSKAAADEINKVVEGFSGSMASLPPPETKPKFYERSCCRVTLGILKEMSDFGLLVQNLGFFLIVLSNFFVFSGFFTPFLYMTKIAEEQGIPTAKAALLISIVGAVNIPTRMLFGFIADRRYIAPINLNTFSVAISTVALFLYFKLCVAFWSSVIFSVLLATGIAGINCLTTMYLIDLVGLKKFSNAIGIVNLFRGFGCFVGPFASGLISEKFGKVECFFFSAVCFGIGLVLSTVVSLRSKICPPKDDNDVDGRQVASSAIEEAERNPLKS